MNTPLRRIGLVVSTATRLDRLLLEELQRSSTQATPSRAKLKDLFRAGLITVDGRHLAASAFLQPGSYEIGIHGPLSADTSARPSPRGCFLPVVYEDDRVLILNKLSGIPTLPHSPEETDTAVSAALARFPELASIGKIPGEGGLEPGLLHRLDTGTSGLLAFARTQKAFEELKAAWKTNAVRKVYRAIAPLPQDSASFPQTVCLKMAHSSRSSKRMIVVEDETRPNAYRGTPQETRTRLLSARPTGAQPTFGDFEIEIETGAMHQIRCTLHHMNSPILGDPIYGNTTSERLWLHAWRLCLPIPERGELWLEGKLPDNWPV